MPSCFSSAKRFEERGARARSLDQASTGVPSLAVLERRLNVLPLSENSGRGKAQDAAQLPEWMAKALMIAFILGMLAWRLRLPAVRGPLELGVAGPSRSLH